VALEGFKYDEVSISRECHEQIFSRNEGKTVVVSDETLCDTPQLYYAPYVLPRDVIAWRLFRLFQPAKIIFTIRRQEDYVSSMYLNLKRNSAFFSQMPVPPLSDWYRGMLSQLRCHYLQNLRFSEAIGIYEQIFGRDNILVLPLEQLIVDGPRKYLQTLCDFVGIGLADEEVDRYTEVQNKRMSHLQSLACDLLADDRFFSIYTTLEQEFGREQLAQFLDRGERARAVLDDEALADLRSRVGSDNRLLAEEYHLNLERYGYALAETSAKPARVKGVSPAREASSSQIDHLSTIIETERQAKTSQISEMEKTFAGKREAAIARIRELEAMLEAEHNAFVARIRELEASLDGERRAQADQIVEMQKTFAAEREAAIARIRELEAMLEAEHNAFVARIRELEASLDGERRAQASQIVEMQKAFAAEREAAIARIRELEATLGAEHDAFVARIDELDQTLSESIPRRVLTRILQAVNKQAKKNSNLR
jgi:hypothetical protein